MSTTEESDEILVGRYVRGDAAAFDQLYRRHELRVWRYLKRHLRNPATADELLQEVWFALARNAASIESTKRFRTRLFTLAYDRMSTVLQGRVAHAANQPAATRDSADPLTQAIGELPREQREAYLLQMEGQLSVGEIAEITEITIDTAHGRLRQARLKLRELLNEKT
jgi:RNA polymerase sigma-70 factor (ECF subfamily)